MKKPARKKRDPYYDYMMLGSMYVLIIVVFVWLDFLQMVMILHALVPAAMTMWAGYMATQQKENSLWPKIMALFSALIFVATPLYMSLTQGGAWLDDGGLQVILIYMAFAASQFYLANSLVRK